MTGAITVGCDRGLRRLGHNKQNVCHLSGRYCLPNLATSDNNIFTVRSQKIRFDRTATITQRARHPRFNADNEQRERRASVAISTYHHRTIPGASCATDLQSAKEKRPDGRDGWRMGDRRALLQ